MTARAMPGVRAEESTRAGCVVIALRGELDVCTADDVVRALTALAEAGARIIVDLAELAFMDCYSLNQLMAVRAQARRAGGDLVLGGPQPIVLRLLVLLLPSSPGQRAAQLPRRPGSGSCHQRCCGEGRP